jgi:hypothetical protein
MAGRWLSRQARKLVHVERSVFVEQTSCEGHSTLWRPESYAILQPHGLFGLEIDGRLPAIKASEKTAEL